MICPPAVARGLRRVSAGMLAVIVTVAGAGWLWSRQQLGATPVATQARVEADLRSRLADLAEALDRAVRPLASDATRVETAAGGAAEAVSGLFSQIAAVHAATGPSLAALTVYGNEGTPLAWEGRPASLPAARVTGPAASFLVSTPLGLRLARLEPVLQTSGGRRRVGAVVAEAALSTAGAAPGVSASPVRIPGRLAPVLFGPIEPHAGDPAAFDVMASDGRPLGTARVSAGDIDEARSQWWGRVLGLLWAAAAVWLVLLWGPLADWRDTARTRGAFVILTLATGTAGGGAWACAVRALEAAGVAGAASYRLLAAALLAVSLAALVVGTAERWRAARSMRARLASPRVRASLGPWLAAGLAGTGAGALAARHARIVDSVIPGTALDAARIALTAFDPGRLAVAAGSLLLHAAAFVLLLTVARVVTHLLSGRMRAPHHAARGLLAVAAAVAAAWWWSPAAPAFWTALPIAAAGLGMGAAWDRARRILRHGSQPARLLVLFAALALPSLSAYPSLAARAARGHQDAIERDLAQQVANQRMNLQLFLREALAEIDLAPGLADLVAAAEPVPVGQVPADAAFRVWSQTSLSSRRLTSSVELYDPSGRVVSRFALNLPETAADQAWQETSCGWELFEEVSPFFAEERRLLHAGRAVCVNGRTIGSVVVHVVLDYGNLPFLAAHSPYVGLMRATAPGGASPDQDDVAFVVYGWSRRPLFVSGGEAWPISEALFSRLAASRAPFWATIDDRGVSSDVYLQNDRGAIYAIGYPRTSLLAHWATVAELVALAALTFFALLVAVTLASLASARAPLSGRALFREVRASFYRTLFLAFVAAVVVPVVALALVTRAYMATSLRQDIEREATRTVLSASRVVEDFATIESRGATNLPALDDSLLVWLSRVIGEDINVFAGTGLLASSERNLFASGLLPTRTPGDIYRALVLEGRPTYIAREAVGTYEYLVASAPVRVDDQQAIVSVPLTLRQRGIERQVDELDRRVLLAAIAFILLGSAIGYWAAERISDPVSRLTRATRRLAAGDLDARVLVRTSDELGRLVEAFNGMADDLRRQRGQLERTNRLEAWAEMARQVAHDIKNPLTPIQLNAEHLRRVHVDRGRPLGALVDDCVHNILLQVRLLRQLASEFSSFASSPEARPTDTPLAPLLDEILAPYTTALAGRISITHEVAGSEVVLMVDRVLLARALTNVIENALHAMPGEGRLSVSAAPVEDGAVRIDVTDTGVGMDAAALARIFEPYFSTKATGTGLGLTIARRNVELNRGRISVASTRGVGTTVSLWLPAA